MSDTKECCVCYEATEHSTPCNHLLCEPCFQEVLHCPLCRTPFNNGVAPTAFSDDEPESESESESDDEILDYNHAMVEAAYRGSPC